jgi:hypothetical protein
MARPGLQGHIKRSRPGFECGRNKYSCASRQDPQSSMQGVPAGSNGSNTRTTPPPPYVFKVWLMIIARPVKLPNSGRRASSFTECPRLDQCAQAIRVQETSDQYHTVQFTWHWDQTGPGQGQWSQVHLSTYFRPL